MVDIRVNALGPMVLELLLMQRQAIGVICEELQTGSGPASPSMQGQALAQQEQESKQASHKYVNNDNNSDNIIILSLMMLSRSRGG